MSRNIHEFGKCFKKKRAELGKGAAYKECNSKYNIEKLIKGKLLPDGVPKHDMYNLTEEACSKIDRLLKKL